VLIGRLTRDPELRHLPNGGPVAGFTLAVDRPFKNQAGERETDFVTITTWRKLAEQASRYLDKGRLVAVEGRLQIRSYETQDGQRRKVAEVVADGIRFLDSGKRNGQRVATVAEAQEQAAEGVPAADDTREAPVAEDDVPF
jgi:single-strand DNA-binding protein